ncbi:hypothetical protein [Alteromonas sp. BMJM2]|uniref:hypothetical protein n=1 Tax=Alteromonas sp. BMJM2 TaxID=2954241 RepID=UPI0022B50463|nr:hypothetical protein [Alteromonas sp. BMJM2]
MDVSLPLRKLLTTAQQSFQYTSRTFGKFATQLFYTSIIGLKKLGSLLSHLQSFWKSLTFAQLCFLISLVILIVMVSLDSLEFVYTTIPSFIILAGLTHEFWPHFLKIWDSLQGKAFILTFYAIMANTALASASGLVNEVTRVSAEHLTYSQNVALIINIPTWFILSSFLMLLAVQILFPLYLLLLIVLKPFGIDKTWHKPHYRFPLTTAVIRYILATYLLIFFLFGSIQSGFLNQSSPVLGSVYVGFINADGEVDTSDNASTDFEEANLSTPSSEVKNTEQEQEQEDEDHFSRDAIIRKSDGIKLTQKEILAEFIYSYEANLYSRCKHPENTRVIELNDYEILTVKKSETADLGYEFEVIACVSPGINSTS